MKDKEAQSIFSSLENFSSIPPPELWDNIEAELEKPKKKKRPLVWWWVAAGLVAGLSIPALLFDNSNPGNTSELNIKNNTKGVVYQKDLDKTVDPIKNKNANKKNADLDLKENKFSWNKNNAVVSNSVSKNASKVKEPLMMKTVNKEPNNQTIVANTDKSKSDVTVANDNVKVLAANNEKNKDSELIKNKNAALIANSKSNILSNTPDQNNELVDKSKLIITDLKTNSSSVNNEKGIAQNTNSKDSNTIIKEELAQLEQTLVDVDKEKTKKKTDSEAIDKWSLQLFAGVTSSENFNKEKALGNTVSSKQSSGYGVKTNYKLNKKWVVSSGFKINELGQQIEGVSYSVQSGFSSPISGMLPILSDNSLQNGVGTNSTIVYASTNGNYLFALNSKSVTGFEKGNVTQNLKYFEMPLEISYALLSKKRTNISMNTGGFVGKLISNEMLLNGSSIGQNNNVNEYVYGTLLSSILQYEFYKKTKFFVEPGMNYYINPLENQSFNQFQWMFNFGLNVTF